MVPVGRRNLFAEKTRLLISVGGVAFSVLLVLILLGLYQGFGEAASSYVNSIDADLWVSQDGSSDMFHGISLMPNDVRGRLESLPEVENVYRLLGRQVAFDIGGKEAHTYIMGYDTGSDVGGPIQIVQGASEPKRGQIIIDRVFAQSENLKIGDRLTIVGRDFEVAGISAQGNMMLYQYSFIAQSEAEELLKMSGFSNFFMVKLKEPAEKDNVIQEISRIPGIQAVSKPEFARINSEMVNDAFLPIVGVLVIIGFGVGVTVIGLTIYTATVEKSREYGVLKAVGASNWQLYKIIFEQAIISGALGYVIGAILTWVVIFFAEGRVPSFVVSIEPSAMIGVFGMSILMSLAASYIPIRRIVRIDPAMVFKS
ncbi:MAG: FtsX-like permease family protein [Chloroflexi bacterium]|nr:FtsX-like permease family protein [Chloroflexota bacterium]